MLERNQIHSGVFGTVCVFTEARPKVCGLILVLALLCWLGVKHSLGNDAGQATIAVDIHERRGSAAAIEKFWGAYHGNDYEAIPELQAEITRALRQDAGNSTLYALLGATHFWHVGEYTRDPNPNLETLQQDMPTAASLFQRALDLDYHGQHLIGYVNDDHLPGYLGITMVHTGQQNIDPDLIAKGDEVLDQAAYQFPEFNNFNRWAGHNTDPKDSDTYKKALESLWQGLDTCLGTRIDRLNPDVRSYLHLMTSVGRKKACWWGGDLAPYSFEGYLLNLGNGLVKAGEIDAARIIYDDARYADNYETWPYRDVLEAIAVSDLNARAAMYEDPNPANHPPLGVPNRGCVYCHATVAEHDGH